ncbi:Gfo/Idh/MocA family protein [Gracilibacillus phocaeensis]|uniref:Gfo/Idh/MocA family protein n=1 Tax=Gracilibacillus phocaeensis TaxID=2042304 RepID=UPI0010303D89|nr:Gfo/Idh/MocA family oxidoreductase [Gracilibacillus phocaeensis]
MDQPIKIAIVGAGGVSDSHVDGWKRCDDVEIIAVIDVDEAQAKSKVEKWEIKANVFQTIEALVEWDRPDLVDICTPEHIHKLMGLKAIEHNIPVFSEKILAASLEDGFDMVTAARETGIWTAINYNYHYFPCFSILKQIVKKGENGTAQEMYVQTHSFCFHHVLETLIWIFGMPATVYAEDTNRDWPEFLVDQFKIAENLVYIPNNSFSVKMEFKSGLTIHVNASMQQSLNSLPFSYFCLFDSGKVLHTTELDWENDMIGKVHWLPNGENLVKREDFTVTSNTLGFRASVHQVSKHFINKQQAPSTWDDGWNVMVVDHAIYISGLQKTKINVLEIKKHLENTLGESAHE